MFLKYVDVTIQAPNSSIRALIFHTCQAEKTVSIRTPDSTIRSPNWQFPETSISPILSHFHIHSVYLIYIVILANP